MNVLRSGILIFSAPYRVRVREQQVGPVSRPTQLYALTGVRLVAAVWVVAHHFRDHLVQLVPVRPLMPVLDAGWLGVDLFFVLSGFILAYTYADRFAGGVDRRAFATFVRYRLARIYPVHVVMLHLMLLAGIGARARGFQLGPEDHSLRAYLENLLLVQAWFGQPYSFNGPAWSISAEWFAYLLFPLGVVLLARVQRLWASWAGFLGSLAVFGVSSALDSGAGDSSTPDAPLLRIATEFTAGCFAYRIWSLDRGRGAWWGRALPALVVAVVALTFVPGLGGVVLPFAVALVVLGLAYDRGPVARLLSHRWMVYGGEASYALYMTHILVILVGTHLLPSGTGAPVAVRLAVLAVWVLALATAAVLMFETVEKPARRWVRDLSLRRPLPTPADTPAVAAAETPGDVVAAQVLEPRR